MIPIDDVQIEFRADGQRITPEDDGYLGRLTKGRCLFSITIAKDAPIIPLHVNLHKQVAKLSLQEGQSGARRYRLRVFIKQSRKGEFFYTQYPESAFRLLRIDRDGRVRLWEVTLTVQHGHFFQAVQLEFDGMCFRGRHGVECPWFRAWTDMHALIAECAEHTLADVLTRRPFVRTEHVDASQLAPGIGYVLRYHEGSRLGVVITHKGSARIHGNEIRSSDRYVRLVAGQYIDYERLSRPHMGKYGTTHTLQVNGVRVIDPATIRDHP